MATTATAITTEAHTERVDYGRLVPLALAAAALAAVLNALVFVVASALGALPQSVLIPSPVGAEPLAIGQVIGFSVFGVLAGALVLAALGRFVRRPFTVFRIVALVVLVVSFASPFSVPGAPVPWVLTLELTHVVAALAAIGILAQARRA